MKQRLREVWQRFRHDETGALCVSQCMEVVDGVLGPKLKTDGGLVCDGDGLHVVFPAGVVVPGVSPDACNGFALRGNGYYSPCPDAITGLAQATNTVDPVTMPLSVPGSSNNYLWKSGIISITNTLCCEVSGTISIRAGGLYLAADDGFYGQANLDVNPNGTGMVPAFPDTTQVFENQSGGVLHTSFNNFVDENWLTIAAGATVTYQAAVNLFVSAAPGGTMTGTIGFEFNWTCPQTGCC